MNAHTKIAQLDAQNTDWWRGGVIYQVYPRSFQDSDGDGIGDIPGITERLPYIASLGVDAVVSKPIEPDHLLVIVASLLNLSTNHNWSTPGTSPIFPRRTKTPAREIPAI